MLARARGCAPPLTLTLTLTRARWAAAVILVVHCDFWSSSSNSSGGGSDDDDDDDDDDDSDDSDDSGDSSCVLPGEERAFRVFMALLARGRGGGRDTSLFNLSELWEASLYRVRLGFFLIRRLVRERLPALAERLFVGCRAEREPRAKPIYLYIYMLVIARENKLTEITKMLARARRRCAPSLRACGTGLHRSRPRDVCCLLGLHSLLRQPRFFPPPFLRA